MLSLDELGEKYIVTQPTIVLEGLWFGCETERWLRKHAC